MGKQEKLEKAAAKAYDQAEEAVKQARKAAKKLDSKKSKKLVDALDEQLSKIKKPAATDAAPHAEPQEAGGHPEASLPLPNVTDTAAEFVGSATTSGTHDPALDQLTVQALRDVARTRGLRNVSRLTKPQLIERLSE